MSDLKKYLKQAILEAEKKYELSHFSSGELANELRTRLAGQPLHELKITAKGTRVTHRDFIDKLMSAKDIDTALNY